MLDYICTPLISICSMTFEDLKELNPIRANINEGVPSNLKESRRRDGNPFNNPILEVIHVLRILPPPMAIRHVS